MAERGFDITDPKQWNALPASQRIAAVTELQSTLVMQALRHTSAGKTLLSRREAGQKLTTEMLLIEHRDEPTVDAKTRKKMVDAEFASGEPQFWRVRLYPLSGQPPKNASKDFKHWFAMAKKWPPRPGTDCHCIIASEGKAFFVGVSIDAYLNAINPPPPPGAEEAARNSTAEFIEENAAGVSAANDSPAEAPSEG